MTTLPTSETRMLHQWCTQWQEWLTEVLEQASESNHLHHPHFHHSSTPHNMTGHPSSCLLVIWLLFADDLWKNGMACNYVCAYPDPYLGTIFGTVTEGAGGPCDPFDPPDAALCCDFWDSLSPPFNMALPLAHLSLAESFSLTSFSSCWGRVGGNSDSGDCLGVSKNWPEWFDFCASCSITKFPDFFAFLTLFADRSLSKWASNLKIDTNLKLLIVQSSHSHLSGSDIEYEVPLSDTLLSCVWIVILLSWVWLVSLLSAVWVVSLLSADLCDGRCDLLMDRPLVILAGFRIDSLKHSGKKSWKFSSWIMTYALCRLSTLFRLFLDFFT